VIFPRILGLLTLSPHDGLSADADIAASVNTGKRRQAAHVAIRAVSPTVS
jgi:hypothetical protein